MKEDGCVAVGARLFVPMPILLFKIDAKHLSQNHSRRDDANHTQRISAGIGNGNVFAFVAQHIQRFLRRTEARRVGDGAVMHAQNLRKRHGTLQNQKERDRHENAQTHRQQGEQIELQAAAFEGRKEGRPDLQTDEEHKEDEPEISEEVENRSVDGDAGVAHGQSYKKNEGDAKRNAEHLEASQGHAKCNDHRVHQKNVTD